MNALHAKEPLLVNKVVAYIVAAVVGASIFRGRLFLEHNHYIQTLTMLCLDILGISVLVLPFWISVTRLAVKIGIKTPLFYLIAGAIIGGLLEPMLLSVSQQMMWDSGPELDYLGRLYQILKLNGVTFIIMGIVSSACYWLIAVRLSARN